MRGLGGAGESSVGATVDATGSGHTLAIACQVPRQRAHGSGCTAPGTPAGSTVHEARLLRRSPGRRRAGTTVFQICLPAPGSARSMTFDRTGTLDRPGPHRSQVGHVTIYYQILLNYTTMCHVNQRRTRVFESNRPSPVFAVVSPRERPMTALRGAARARHRIDVPSR